MSAHDTPLDDVALATCSGCDRSTWSAQEVGRTCSMRQPDGSRCAGQFTPASPDPVQPADAGEGRHELLPFAKCSCGAEHDRRGTGESGYDWFARHMNDRLAAVVGERDGLERLAADQTTKYVAATSRSATERARAEFAEAALATALREKAEDRAARGRVEVALDCPHGPKHYYAVEATCQRCEMPSWVVALFRGALANPTGGNDV